MQNTLSQSGNDSKWFSKKSFFRIGMWHLRPPPFMAKAILNFHFDYLKPSLAQLDVFCCLHCAICINHFFRHEVIFVHFAELNTDLQTLIVFLPPKGISFLQVIFFYAKCCSNTRNVVQICAMLLNLSNISRI